MPPILLRPQQPARDARLFQERKRPGAHDRRHPQERHQIHRMVDIHSDARLSDDQRLDAATSRRIEMGVEAVFAETQRDGVRRRTDDRVRSDLSAGTRDF
jgi:hypothetical protein